MNHGHHGLPPAGFAFACPMCPNKQFSRRDKLRRHFDAVHAKRWFLCTLCSVEVHTRSGMNRHIRNVHNVTPEPYGKCPPVNYPEELFRVFVRVPGEDADEEEEEEAVETPISPIVEFPASPSPLSHDSETPVLQVAEEVEDPVDSVVELPTSPPPPPSVMDMWQDDISDADLIRAYDDAVHAEEVEAPAESTVELPTSPPPPPPSAATDVWHEQSSISDEELIRAYDDAMSAAVPAAAAVSDTVVADPPPCVYCTKTDNTTIADLVVKGRVCEKCRSALRKHLAFIYNEETGKSALVDLRWFDQDNEAASIYSGDISEDAASPPLELPRSISSAEQSSSDVEFSGPVPQPILVIDPEPASPASEEPMVVDISSPSPPPPPPPPLVKMQRTHFLFMCEVCDKHFNNDASLQRHRRHMHKLNENRDSVFQCSDCGAKFRTRWNLIRHRRQHCQSYKSPPPPSPPPPPPPPSSGAGGGGGGGGGASTSQVGDGSGPSAVSPSSPAGGSSSSSNDNASTTSDNVSEAGDMELPANLAPDMFAEIETAFRSRLKTYRLRDKVSSHVTIPEFLVYIFDNIVTLVRRILTYVSAIKMNIWLECEFVNVHQDTCRRAFKTKNTIVMRSTDLEEMCGDLFQKLVDEKEACEMKGSGWTFVRVVDMEIRVNVYRPLGGSSYIPLPPDIQAKKAVINVYNDADHKCFQYAMLTRFVENIHHEQLRVIHFTDEVRRRAQLDFEGLKYPVTLQQIPSFEKRNGISISVYGLDLVPISKKKKHRKKKHNIVYPIRVCEQEEAYPDHFDLLMLTSDKSVHYLYIKDFARLVHTQLTLNCNRLFICKRCFAHFNNRTDKLGLNGPQRLAEHKKYCVEHAAIRTDLSEDKDITFFKFERTRRARFTIYADFECALVPYDGSTPLNPTDTVNAPPDDPAIRRGETLPHHRHGAGISSNNVQVKMVHKPYAYAYYVRDYDLAGDEQEIDDGNTYSTLRLYRGKDAAHHFMESLKKDIAHIRDLLYGQRRTELKLTPAEEVEFQAATECYLCHKGYGQEMKVRDHNHAPPYQYRGAAHASCNLRYHEQDTINCYFHNLSNYDAHFVVRELDIDKGDVRVLANTEEKYITFLKTFHYPGDCHEKMSVRFVDSYRFLSRGLAYLVSILPEDKFHCTHAYHQEPTKFSLLHRKGVFPYEYVTSLDVLQETVLPPVQAFRDSLRQEDVSAKDYAHAQTVWREFDCATLGDYADVYLRGDVLLLADVFEAFRDKCMHTYELDPAHWLTLPSYAWDVMLYKTGVTLYTLQDVDQYLFFEKGIRGGLTQCVTRHAIADNKYVRATTSGEDGNGSDDMVGTENDNFIMYFDANNLYGWAMSQPLPYGGFQWLSPEEIGALNIEEIGADSDTGYVLEVDLEYPQDKDLQDRHRDLPFCPEMRRAPMEQLPYPPDILKNYNVGKSLKLMSTLLDKDGYVIHYRLLQQALKNGLRIRRIHRVLQFKQSTWLRPYVAMNTELRRLATNKFEVELYKLMVNAVYGMSLQNVRKHINIKLVTNEKTYTKYVAKSNFADRTWYKKDLAMLHMSKVRIILDKPVYVGMSILDHSKTWMYGFHYRMLDLYGLDRIRLLYMDTDSLIYDIRTPDAYRDMMEHNEDFDTSNYPQDHFCFDNTNAMVLGKFKDEVKGVPIKEFIGLMAKLYCIVFANRPDAVEPEEELQQQQDDGPSAPKKPKLVPPVKRAKGVNRGVVSHGLTVDDYRRCLLHHTVKGTENDRFQTRHHIIYSVKVTKRSLAPFDDKRYIVLTDRNGATTLPWGHYDIPPAAAAAAEEAEDDARMQ